MSPPLITSRVHFTIMLLEVETYYTYKYNKRPPLALARVYFWDVPPVCRYFTCILYPACRLYLTVSLWHLAHPAVCCIVYRFFYIYTSVLQQIHCISLYLPHRIQLYPYVYLAVSSCIPLYLTVSPTTLEHGIYPKIHSRGVNPNPLTRGLLYLYSI